MRTRANRNCKRIGSVGKIMLNERFGINDCDSIDIGAKKARPINVFSGEITTRTIPNSAMGTRGK